MPIVKSCTYKVVFDRLFIDTANGTATAYFTQYLDDVKFGADIVHTVGPDVVGPLLYATPTDPTQTRSVDIALAVYNLAIQQGWFTGTIV